MALKIKDVPFQSFVYELSDEKFVKHCKKCKIGDSESELIRAKRAGEKKFGIKTKEKSVKETGNVKQSKNKRK